MKYEEPKFEVVKVNTTDVIRTSGDIPGGGGEGGGSGTSGALSSVSNTWEINFPLS